MDAVVVHEAIPGDAPHYTLMTQSYYNHLFASKMERSSLYAKRLGVGRLFHRRGIKLLHDGPVHQIPPCLEEIRAAVLVEQIVGVLPNVHN